MIERKSADLVVLGAGPAGMAAACAATESGAAVLVVEREERAGGILKQCVHDGFGLVRYGEKLTGPEYALRDAATLRAMGIPVMYDTFVSRVARDGDGFILHCVNRDGITELRARALVLATGCRERTDRQVFIHGDRPAGVYTAGLAQYLVNVQGLKPGRKAVILGSGDIGLIMARRLCLEGVEVEGVYEIKNEPSGLSRNVRQCLEDFSIPLELSTTVLAVHGRRRVEGVTLARVDDRLRPIPGSERELACDTLVLSVGLIPENELARSLEVPLDGVTRGPRVDQDMHTLADGVFACGNAVHVNDLVDYVSESGAVAGEAAAAWARGGRRVRSLVPLKAGPGFLYAVPQFVDAASERPPTVYFRSNSTMPDGATVSATTAGGSVAFSRRWQALRPPEMERFTLPAGTAFADEAGLLLGLERNGR